MKKLAVVTALVLLLAYGGVRAAEAPSADAGFGEELVRRLWATLKAGNMEQIASGMAQGFQSVHQDGARTREQQLALTKDLHLGAYTLSSFQTTRNGPVLVVTYLVSVAETIDGKRLSKKPEPRLSVFLETDGRWQWMAHANLKPLVEQAR